MKLEVEITEEEIKSAIERKIRVAVAEYSSGYGADSKIKDLIKLHWNEIVDKTIREEIENIPVIREKIRVALENKIKGQLTAAIKAGSK